jgi:hypothetical protein
VISGQSLCRDLKETLDKLRLLLRITILSGERNETVEFSESIALAAFIYFPD